MELKHKIFTRLKGYPLRLWLPLLLALLAIISLGLWVFYAPAGTPSPEIVLRTPTSSPEPTTTPLAMAADENANLAESETPSAKPTLEAVAPAPILYLSLAKDVAQPLGSVEGVQDEDILSFDGADFALVFDGSAAGLPTSLDVDAFHFVETNVFLLSFDRAVSLGPLQVDDSDIVKFEATSLGPDNTSGAFSLFFEGSELDLTSGGENVDAVALLPDGTLLISTEGRAKVSGANRSVRGEKEDILAFSPAETGNYSSGDWALYFDGANAGIKGLRENINGLAAGPEGELYLTTSGNFSVKGLTGGSEDVFMATPASLETRPAYHFSSDLFFEGSLYGLQRNNIDAISIP